MYVFTCPLHCGLGVAQGQFLSCVKLAWIQFSFSLIDFLTKVKEPSALPMIHRWDIRWIQALSKSISAMWNANSLIQDLNTDHYSFPMMITLRCSSFFFFNLKKIFSNFLCINVISTNLVLYHFYFIETNKIVCHI